jgi:hypothetical protein
MYSLMSLGITKAQDQEEPGKRLPIALSSTVGRSMSWFMLIDGG